MIKLSFCLLLYGCFLIVPHLAERIYVSWMIYLQRNEDIF